MAKASISLNDTFTFKFPQRKEESSWDEANKKIVTEFEPYPGCLLEHFLTHAHRIEFAHKGITSKFMDWQHQYKPEADAFYLLEMSLEFQPKDGNKVGGYTWMFDAPADNKLAFSDLKKVEEDEEWAYLSIHIQGEITWDFKPNHLAKIRQNMDRHCSWDEVAMNLGMIFRENYLWKNEGFSGYKAGMEVLESEQTIDNLPFILDRMPKSFWSISHRSPKKEWELAQKHWLKLSDKNITFGGKYLSRFNP
jgi:hypothetical protein